MTNRRNDPTVMSGNMRDGRKMVAIPKMIRYHFSDWMSASSNPSPIAQFKDSGNSQRKANVAQ